MYLFHYTKYCTICQYLPLFDTLYVMQKALEFTIAYRLDGTLARAGRRLGVLPARGP